MKWSRHRFLGLTIILTHYSIAFLERATHTHTHMHTQRQSLSLRIHFSFTFIYSPVCLVREKHSPCSPVSPLGGALPPCHQELLMRKAKHSSGTNLFFFTFFFPVHSFFPPSPREALRRGVPKRPISKFLPHLHPDDRCENWAGASIDAHACLPVSSGATCHILRLIGYGFLITS